MIKKVIKLSASWCFPCKMYAKTFEEVSQNVEFKDITFEEIDIEENEDVVEKYLVRSVPTTVVLDENDRIIHKVSGVLTKNNLEEILRGNFNG